MHRKGFHIKSIGIQNVLLSAFIVVILPPFIVQIIMYSNFVNTYKQELINSNMQYVNEYRLNMEYNLKELISTCISIYTVDEYTKILNKSLDRPQIEKYRDQRIFQNYIGQALSKSSVRGIYIYSQNSETYIGNSNIGFINVNERLPDSQWLNSIKPSNSNIAFLGTHAPKQLIKGSLVFSLVQNIIDQDTGKNLGLMLLDVAPEMLGNAYKNSEHGYSRQLLVVDPSHTIVYHSDQSMIMKTLEGDQFNAIYSNDKGNIIYSSGKTKYLATYTSSKLTGWKVINISPLDTAMEGVKTIGYLVWLAIASLLVAIVISKVFSQLIGKPLKNLSISMKSMEEGSFSAVPIAKFPKETYLLNKGFNSMINKIENLLKNEFQLKLLKKDAEFKALQAQINPHFLYNTLESISVLADIKKVPEISKICRVLSNMFRYSIGTKSDIIQLRYEIEHIRDYISIIRLRFEDQIQIQIDISDEFYDYAIPKLVLQPLVENCIIHGFSDLSEDGTIILRAFIKEDNIFIDVEDNGMGISAERQNEIREMLYSADDNNIMAAWQDKSSSIGLKNIHLRLRSYFGANYGITDINSSVGQGTKITLTIPAKKL